MPDAPPPAPAASSETSEEMSAEELIFAGALEQPGAPERAAYLESACAGDSALRRRVERLLKSHSGAGSFLAAPPLAETMENPLAERPGTLIGPYKLLQQIGEGGMGVVYMAEQETPVRRRVAVKVIKPGMDSRQVIARFEAERQALAMMEHQNVARVLDAGTTATGRPYFVMELVHGVPLIKFCEDNRLTPRQRLELFVPICHAIQHAHQKGVIHRDIKPGNILVTMYDDKPVPKVIDFGVAKAVEQRLTERTLFTNYGTMVGTIEYMSPEQAEMNALGVDTRSDIYSLGVLLYEMLTGTTPLDRPKVREAALMELVRMIKEDEPPRPSLRLTTSGTLPVVAAACRTEPARLSQLLHELDWIVMKCLEKDRTRRYETANGLARDVERYLRDEPVEACPPSWRYRLGKVARKRRGLLTAAACVVVILLAGIVVSSTMAAWALRAQRSTEDAQHRTQAALANEQAARTQAEAAKERLESAAARLDKASRLANDGILESIRGNYTLSHTRLSEAARIEPALVTAYIFRGDLYAKLGLWDLAAPDLDRRLKLTGRAGVQNFLECALLKLYVGDDAGYRAVCAAMVEQHGASRLNDDQWKIVMACGLSPEAFGDAAALVRRAEGLVSSAYQPWNLSVAGLAHLRAGDSARAVARLNESIDRGGKSPAGVHRLNYFPLAIGLHQLGRKDQAAQALARGEEAIEEWTRTIAKGPVGTMPIRWTDWLEAVLLHREARRTITGSPVPEDPRLTTAYDRALAVITSGDAATFVDAGRAHMRRKAWPEAADAFAEALEQLPPVTEANWQQFDRCVEMVQQSEVFERLALLRPDDSRIWHAHARTLADRREWAAAARDYQKTLALWSVDINEAQPAPIQVRRLRALAMKELATLRLLTGDDAGYRKLCAASLSLSGQTDDAFIAAAVSRTCTLAPGTPADGTLDGSVALRLADSAVDKSPRVAWFVYARGAAQHRTGQYEAAIATLEESLKVHPAWVGRGQNYVYLALACQRLNRPDDARRWLAQAEAWLTETDQLMAAKPFGYAASPYLGDWLSVQTLLREARSAQ